MSQIWASIDPEQGRRRSWWQDPRKRSSIPSTIPSTSSGSSRLPSRRSSGHPTSRKRSACPTRPSIGGRSSTRRVVTRRSAGMACHSATGAHSDTGRAETPGASPDHEAAVPLLRRGPDLAPAAPDDAPSDLPPVRSEDAFGAQPAGAAAEEETAATQAQGRNRAACREQSTGPRGRPNSIRSRNRGERSRSGSSPTGRPYLPPGSTTRSGRLSRTARRGRGPIASGTRVRVGLRSSRETAPKDSS